MNTLKKGFSIRLMSVILTVLMLFSVFSVGIVSTSAATVDVVETSASITFAEGDYIYMKNFTPSGWSATWFYGDVYEWMHLYNSTTQASIDVQFELVEGSENASNAVYGAKVTTAGTYTHVVFTRSHSSTDPWNQCNKTGNISLSATFNCYTNLSVGGTSYTGSTYTPSGVVAGDFWIDVDGNVDTTDDVIKPSSSGKYYLPSAPVYFFTSEGTMEIDGKTVTKEGAKIDLATGTHNLGGDFSGSIKVIRSKNVSSIHTTTKVSVPQGTYQGYAHKDDYETKGTIMVFDKDGKLKNENNTLKKIKGRGNSSWEASHKVVGKYAFNITLDKKAKLLDESSKSKKYCLVSYNADQARMRNAVIYELSQQIGIDYAPDYEPIDFYNNGEYIGSYLLTDKVEIGDPLVDIVNLDDINELLGTVDEDNGPFGKNYEIYDADDISSYRGYVNGLQSTSTTKGFYKYVKLEEPDPSLYAESGFLLEFELDERFPDEISGFISDKGQQIVCKYPEYASKAQMEFVMGKWNSAESVMYNESASYAQLDAVIDVESFAKMYLIQELTKNLDGGATSYYVFYDGGKFHAGVSWDFDWALGQYRLDQGSKINSGSDFYGNVNANPADSGGWYLNSKNIYNRSTLNAQAALCQNDNFWSVVVAEWDEIFFSEAKKFADSAVSSVSELDGLMKDLYELVKYSTILDEDKWNIISDNPLYAWGSADTGSTHDSAVKNFNNWFYNRIMWMDKYISRDGSSHTGIYNIDYVIQAPSISADKDSYAAGDTVTLTIDDKTDGSYTYTIYKDGEEIGTTTEKEYTFTADKVAAGNYSVIAKSNSSNKVSPESEETEIVVEGFKLTFDASAPSSVTAGDVIAIDIKSDVTDYKVVYKLYLGEEFIIETTTTNFEYATKAADAGKTLTFTVVAEVTVDGEIFTASKELNVAVNAFDFKVTLTAPATVEAGMVINLKAQTNSAEAVDYEFYDGKGNILASNGTGLYSVEALDSEIGTDKSFYVVAKTTVGGQTFTTTSEVKLVSVTAVQDVYDVVIYFKSTSSLGYRPLITTEGAVSDLADANMTRDIRIGCVAQNVTQTASYYWYRADVQVSKANPQLAVSILSGRYAMEGDINLTIQESGEIYLAVDNLNTGYEVVDLTNWSVEERNWTESAVNMIYSREEDGEETLLELAANLSLRYVGDSNDDGKVNVRDATTVQKHLVGLTTLDTVGLEISDYNGDNKVTVQDATAILKKLVALI